MVAVVDEGSRPYLRPDPLRQHLLVVSLLQAVLDMVEEPAPEVGSQAGVEVVVGAPQAGVDRPAGNRL